MKETNTPGRRRAVPNYLLIQKAKEDYVQLHDFYAEHEELLNDEIAYWLYESLMMVSTPDQLRQWLEDIGNSSLSLEGCNPLTNGVKWENLLGHYGLLLKRLSPEERETLAFELPKIRENGFGLYFNRNLTMLCSEASSVRKGRGEVIAILYDQIDNHIAVGEDADRLFEIFGWQTATASWGDGQMSVMPISDDILLMLGMFDFQLAETMVDLMDIRVDDPMEAELSIAQQTIDAFRRIFKEDLLFPIEGLCDHSVSHGIEHEYSYPFVEKKGETLSLIRSDAKYETVVSGQSWNVSRERIPLLTSLAENLHILMHEKERQSMTVGMSGTALYTLKAQIVIDEYKNKKSRHDGKRLLVDHGAFLEAYGDDAVSMARQLHLPLWSRYGGIHGEMTMLMLSKDMAEVMEIMYGDVVVEKARARDEMGKMCLRPSFLNDCLSLRDDYGNASVFVRKDGSYAVRASKGREMLPMKEIPRELGNQYLEIQDKLAKRVFLNGILHAVYGSPDRKPVCQSINNQNTQLK